MGSWSLRFITIGSLTVLHQGSKMAGIWQAVRQSPHSLGMPLLCIIGWPVATSWITALLERPASENGLQFGTALLIIIAILRSIQKWRLQPFSLYPSHFGWLFLLISGLGYFIADFYAVKSVLWVSYIGILGGYGWALHGQKLFLRWLPVFLFSAFLLPTVNAEIQMAVSLPLQIASAQLATWLINWLIPVSITETLIVIGENTLQVTPACSGLQSWIGFLFAGLLWQMFEGSRPRMLLWMIPGALILAWMLNGVRLGITAFVTYYIGIEQALALHTNLDWALFPIGLVILWQIGRRLKDPEVSIVENKSDLLHYKVIAVATPALLGLLAVGHLFLDNPAITLQSSNQPRIHLSHNLVGWHGIDVPITPEERKAFGSAQGINREYTDSRDNYLWLKILQSGSIADIHNFYGCLMVQGIQPKILDHLRIQTRAGILNATLMEFVYEDTWFYAILWHQWDAETAANRWQWYQSVLQERLEHRAHYWKIVKLTMPQTKENTQKAQQERQQLIQFATKIYEDLSAQ